MLPFKTNVKIFIIEFACVVLIETIYAVSSQGIETAFMVSLGLLPVLCMALLAIKVKNENLMIRCLYIASIFVYFFMSQVLHTQQSLPFMMLAAGVTIALFVRPKILMEYFCVTVVILILMGVLQTEVVESQIDGRLYVSYMMMYAFAFVALQFIIVSVEDFKKEMEEKNEIAREALEAKSNFLANMSHEIRTPMNAIYGMAEILEERKFDREEKEYIATIKRSSENLLSIINEILDFSKVDSGAMVVAEDPYDFNNLLQDVIVIIQFRLREKNVELVVDIDPEIPSVLISDEARIRQILINLLNNAVKFTNRGTITLKAHWHRFDEHCGNLVFYVKDTGIGISEENIKKLFTAFGQLDTRKNRNVEGTGLGLAICKQLTDLMNGSIQVWSKLKEGSTFSVSLPQKVYDDTPCNFVMVTDKYVQNKVDFHISFTAPKANVLIVDDNKVNRQVAKEIMKLFGFDAYLAESGQEALDKIEKHLITYDVVFMDHMMPFMDGVEATKRIRELPSEYAKKIPIIALTANAIKGVEEQFRQAGMNDYISKPIIVQELNDLLCKWLPPNKRFPVGTTLEEIEQMQKQLDFKHMSREEVMEHLEGIDVETGIRNCAGSIDVFFELLQIYATSNLMTLLERYFEEEDLENYGITAHSIKGASKNIGAHEVAELAYSMERAGKRGDLNYIWDHHEEFVELYTKMVRMLKQIFFS